ncbi:unnamed protein product [Haemonchus placei]|uniref:Transcriptional regulator n=1 Tax=Haemonchus placei TaxID=6290 RepID=A0A0N4XA15_HAEPC|nr:unnamed protein product [Haemonchus placei]
MRNVLISPIALQSADRYRAKILAEIAYVRGH